MNWFRAKITKERVKSELREWAEAFLIAAILTLIIRTFFFQAFKIPSSSMEPTLLIGDKLFVNKIGYKFEEPKRWDIVVFKYPLDHKIDYIKRLIGLPGEQIQIQNGVIYVNGEPQEPPLEIRDVYYENAVPYGVDGQVIEVPEDSYFVLGDNSSNSKDSRVWGFVNKNELVGEAVVRWWPLHRLGRLDRVFNHQE